MKTYLLEREQIVPKSRREVFAFFSDAFNLERITPPFLRFRILTSPPIQMKAGALIEYRLALFGIGFRWKTLIESWEPETHFVDRQLKGPYALWHHTHTFEEIAPGQTRMRDLVRYRLPLGPLGSIAHRLFVRRMLDQIFDYRTAATAEILGAIDDGSTVTGGRAAGAAQAATARG